MARIYYYSSTGNSLYVAQSIAKHLGAEVATMNENSCGDDVIGFVFPAYFWGLPRKVESFIKDLKITNSKAYIFSIVTYGSIIYGVNGRVEQLLRQKGLSLHYARQIKCVENYIPYYMANDTDRLFNHVQEKIAETAIALEHRETNQSGWYSPLNHMIHTFYPKATSDSLFQVSSSCIGCGVCQRVCPTGNIRIVQGKPVFQGACEHCLGCVQHCPQRAIEWNSKTVGKPRYRHRQVSLLQLEQNTVHS